MTVDMAWLEENLFHHSLSDSEKEVLQDMVQIRQYKKGDVIIAEQQQVNGLFILSQGSVGLEYEKHGQAVHIARLEAGVQLGDMSLFDGGRASASAIALCDCEVYHLPQQAMQYMMQHRQNLIQDIMQNTIRNLGQAIRQMNDAQAYTQQYMQGVHAA